MHLFDLPHNLLDKQTKCELRRDQAYMSKTQESQASVRRRCASTLLLTSHSSNATQAHANVTIQTLILKDCSQLLTEKEDGAQRLELHHPCCD